MFILVADTVRDISCFDHGVVLAFVKNFAFVGVDPPSLSPPGGKGIGPTKKPMRERAQLEPQVNPTAPHSSAAVDK